MTFPVGELRLSLTRSNDPNCLFFCKGIAVNRQQQLSLVLVLGLISSIPAFAAGPSEQGGGWRASSEDNASSTLSGKLYRNSADQDGSAPYIVLDRWGVVRGYVAAARGVELDSCLGQQVSLQGTIKTLPGGDMPYMTCQRVLGGNTEMTSPRVQRASAAPRRESFVPVAQDQRSQGIALRSELPTRSDMSADPTPRTVTLPLREVVLEPQALPADDDSQDRPSAIGTPGRSGAPACGSPAPLGRASGQLSSGNRPHAYSGG